MRARDTLLSEALQIEKQFQELVDESARRDSERRRLYDAETLLQALREKMDQGLPQETRAELVRCLVRKIVVDRGANQRPLVTVNYAFTPFSFGAEGSAFADTTVPQQDLSRTLMVTSTISL